MIASSKTTRKTGPNQQLDTLPQDYIEISIEISYLRCEVELNVFFYVKKAATTIKYES